MVKGNFLHCLVCLVILLTSCTSEHLITDKEYRTKVESKFSQRESAFGKSCPELFSAVTNEKDLSKKEALEYLIAYMPLNDLADFNVSLLKKSVEVSLKARDEMPWGKISEPLFLSFVLPLRVNNENLDSFRIAYYNEISQRVKGMNEKDAALEINHWCHEKVSYQPSDIRTSAPLSTMLSARGRCGEESTFTVSALRTAGIPARQVYTPRWAHTDDNHAWVEVFVDGKWHYMGACEPEPVLDRGWFTEPARRAMLVHTKAFGNYSGDELVVKRTDNITEINALQGYAVTKEVKVVVSDSTDVPVPGASVDFLLYNYSELYPIASLTTDEKGACSFLTGLGDLVVWAHHDNKFGYQHINVSETDTLKLKIKNQHLSGIELFDLKAPVAKNPLPGPDADLVRINSKRFSTEDSIRSAYIHSWMTPLQAKNIALKVNLDTTVVKEIIAKSMGNYKAIADFITASGEKSSIALNILNNISEKDLRDADGKILTDHLLNVPAKQTGISDEIFNKFVLSPRIDNEKLSSWRSILKKQLPSDILAKFESDPASIGPWIDSSIKTDSKENYYNVPLTPGAVERLRVADAHSIKIFYVALCRTLGIPARFEPGTNRPQYYSSGKWNDVWFNGDIKPSLQKTYITFVTEKQSPVPEYYTNFTLAHFENGTYKTLEFTENLKPDQLGKDIPLDPGRYMLLTGNRINDVTVLARAEFFELKAGEHTNINVIIRKEEKLPEVIGTVPFDKNFITLDGKEISLKSLSSKGIVVLWIKPGTEPTRHIFADIPLLKEEFDKWGGYFIYFVDNGSFDPSQYKDLPSNTVFARDNNLSLLSSVFPDRDIKNAQYPVVIYADKDGKVFFLSEGYRIGIGDQIIKRIN